MAFTSTGTVPPPRRRHILPTVWLLILPAFIAEALSGATPPATFFLQPNILIAFSLYYGSGAILARDMSLRWGRGWPSILLLGGAFAVIQEGLGTKVFFDLTRTELSPLVNYGTVAGVHWVFVIQLIIYHAVYSIALPILLVELLFPSRRAERWVGGLGLILALMCLIVVTWLLYLIYPFPPPAGPYLLAIALAIGLCVLARIAPMRSAAATQPPNTVHASGVGTSVHRRATPGVRRYAVIGLIAGALFFIVSFGAPSAGVPPLLTGLALVVIAATSGWLVARPAAWPPRAQLALAIGLLTPLIALSVLQETRGRTGSVLVALAMLAFLVFVSRRSNRHRVGQSCDPRM